MLSQSEIVDQTFSILFENPSENTSSKILIVRNYANTALRKDFEIKDINFKIADPSLGYYETTFFFRLVQKVVYDYNKRYLLIKQDKEKGKYQDIDDYHITISEIASRAIKMNNENTRYNIFSAVFAIFKTHGNSMFTKYLKLNVDWFSNVYRKGKNDYLGHDYHINHRNKTVEKVVNSTFDSVYLSFSDKLAKDYKSVIGLGKEVGIDLKRIKELVPSYDNVIKMGPNEHGESEKKLEALFLKHVTQISDLERKLGVMTNSVESQRVDIQNLEDNTDKFNDKINKLTSQNTVSERHISKYIILLEQKNTEIKAMKKTIKSQNDIITDKKKVNVREIKEDAVKALKLAHKRVVKSFNTKIDILNNTIKIKISAWKGSQEQLTGFEKVRKVEKKKFEKEKKKLSDDLKQTNEKLKEANEKLKEAKIDLENSKNLTEEQKTLFKNSNNTFTLYKNQISAAHKTAELEKKQLEEELEKSRIEAEKQRQELEKQRQELEKQRKLNIDIRNTLTTSGSLDEITKEADTIEERVILNTSQRLYNRVTEITKDANTLESSPNKVKEARSPEVNNLISNFVAKETTIPDHIKEKWIDDFIMDNDRGRLFENGHLSIFQNQNQNINKTMNAFNNKNSKYFQHSRFDDDTVNFFNQSKDNLIGKMRKIKRVRHDGLAALNIDENGIMNNLLYVMLANKGLYTGQKKIEDEKNLKFAIANLIVDLVIRYFRWWFAAIEKKNFSRSGIEPKGRNDKIRENSARNLMSDASTTDEVYGMYHFIFLELYEKNKTIVDGMVLGINKIDINKWPNTSFRSRIRASKVPIGLLPPSQLIMNYVEFFNEYGYERKTKFNNHISFETLLDNLKDTPFSMFQTKYLKDVLAHFLKTHFIEKNSGISSHISVHNWDGDWYHNNNGSDPVSESYMSRLRAQASEISVFRKTSSPMWTGMCHIRIAGGILGQKTLFVRPVVSDMSKLNCRIYYNLNEISILDNISNDIGYGSPKSLLLLHTNADKKCAPNGIVSYEFDNISKMSMILESIAHYQPNKSFRSRMASSRGLYVNPKHGMRVTPRTVYLWINQNKDNDVYIHILDNNMSIISSFLTLGGDRIKHDVLKAGSRHSTDTDMDRITFEDTVDIWKTGVWAGGKVSNRVFLFRQTKCWNFVKMITRFGNTGMISSDMVAQSSGGVDNLKLGVGGYLSGDDDDDDDNTDYYHEDEETKNSFTLTMMDITPNDGGGGSDVKYNDIREEVVKIEEDTVLKSKYNWINDDDDDDNTSSKISSKTEIVNKDEDDEEEEEEKEDDTEYILNLMSGINDSTKKNKMVMVENEAPNAGILSYDDEDSILNLLL